MNTRVLLGTLAAAALAISMETTTPAAGGWVNATGSLAYKPSDCGNLGLLSVVPGTDTILAGIAGRGVWSNTPDSADRWTHIGIGPGGDTVASRPSMIVYDPENPDVFWVSGIYSGAAVYKTTDAGKTFRRLGSITHADNVSIDFTDPKRLALLAGGHETRRMVQRTIDGGKTWENVGINLPDNTTGSGWPFIINSQTYVVNAMGTAEFAGIYRSGNGGTSWQLISSLQPTAPAMMAADGAVYWPSATGLIKSTDGGWTWRRVGVPVQAVTPIELSGGRLVAVGEKNLILSGDGGVSWATIEGTLPYNPNGLIYSAKRSAFYIWKTTCGGTVPGDAAMRLDIAAS